MMQSSTMNNQSAEAGGFGLRLKPVRVGIRRLTTRKNHRDAKAVQRQFCDVSRILLIHLVANRSPRDPVASVRGSQPMQALRLKARDFRIPKGDFKCFGRTGSVTGYY